MLELTQECVKIHRYNQSEIDLSTYKVYHENIKYIDTRPHFIRDMVESKKIMVGNVVLEDNTKYVFIKLLSRSKFKQCMDLINFVEELYKLKKSNKIVDG